MRLSSLIKEDRILIEMPGEHLGDGVDALVNLIAKSEIPQTLAKIREALANRRGITCDYITRGVAIPHARVEGLEHFHICVGNSRKGLSLEGCPTEGLPGDEPARVHLIILILTPQTRNTLMLQTLAAVARLCHNQDVRAALQNCKSPTRMLRLIEESDVEVKRTVTAADAQRPCQFFLSPDDDLAVVLSQLVKSGERLLPVVDTEKNLVGSVGPTELFKLGLPKYMNILTDIEFLTNFEPFEALFLNEKKLKVSDIVNADAVTVAGTDPIIRVTHEMITRGVTTVFVTDARRRLLGVIDERDILARVLQP